LAAYGPTGEWVRLFSSDPAYLETILLCNADDENQYLTIDFWKSKSARDSFRERYSIEFDRLDSRCEALTKDELFLGDYLEVAENSA
jgi:hypothetical protein